MNEPAGMAEVIVNLKTIAASVKQIAESSDSVKLKTQRDEMAVLAAIGSRLLTEGALLLDHAINEQDQFRKAKALRNLVNDLTNYAQRVKPPVFDD